MSLSPVELILQWIGGLIAFTKLGILLAGIWRGLHRPPGRTTGRTTGWLRSHVFFLLSTALFIGMSVALWRSLPIVLPTQERVCMLELGPLVYFPGIAFILWGRMYFVSTSLGAQLYADHRLVTHGPFALVRHLMY